MVVHLKIIGGLLILLGLFHFVFPKYFKWKDELGSLSIINREMMYVHTFFIALIISLMGILCINSSKELIETGLGKQLCLGLGIFWAARLFIQFFGYSSKTWKGKKLETAIHIVFSILWAYLSTIFILIFLV